MKLNSQFHTFNLTNILTKRFNIHKVLKPLQRYYSTLYSKTGGA